MRARIFERLFCDAIWHSRANNYDADGVRGLAAGSLKLASDASAHYASQTRAEASEHERIHAAVMRMFSRIAPDSAGEQEIFDALRELAAAVGLVPDELGLPR